MLRNTQIKIILTLLTLGIIIIAALGYINYINTQNILSQLQISKEELSFIQESNLTNIRMLTIAGILTFTLVCALVRSFCNRKNNNTNYKNN